MSKRQDEALVQPRDLLPFVIEVTWQAGALLRAEFHRPLGPRGGGSKAPIDNEIESFLMTRLMSLYACGWHGEELGDKNTEHRDRWVVDPNDGTKAFLKGLRGSAISIALLSGDQPALGVVYSPMAPDDTGDLFAWAEGATLQRNGVDLPSLKPVAPKAGARSKSIEDGIVIGFNEEAADFALHNHRKFAPARTLAIPSIAYRLALAAAGEVDAAVSLTSSLNPYDVAGGHAILNAVGGKMRQLDGRSIQYNQGVAYTGCVGGRAAIVDWMVERGVAQGHRVARKRAQPRRRIASSDLLSRAQGTLLGQLAGDALGSYCEFESAIEIRQANPKGVRDLKPGGTWDLLAGQPTDDSEMALALARSLVTNGGFSSKKVASAYIEWGNSQPFDMGTTTRRGLSALEGRGKADHDSQANGALMRVSPLGIYAAGRPELAANLARQDAALTHPNPVCQAASAAFAAAIAAGIAGASPRTMWSVAHANAGDDEGAGAVRKCLQASRTSHPQDYLNHAGWVLTALGNAFHWLWIEAPLEDALIKTVGFGGDTDTNAAICGSLLGAALGRPAIPLRWRQQVLSCRPVDAEEVRRSRPTTYWPDDALDLAEALLVAGGSHQSNRPG